MDEKKKALARIRETVNQMEDYATPDELVDMLFSEWVRGNLAERETAAPTYDPAKVRELVAAALVVAEADAKSELDGIMIEEMARAAQAVRDGEGE